MAKCVIRSRSWRARFWLLVAAAGGCVGCSSQSEETKRHLDLLNERILILQNDRDRLVERVDALEQHKSPSLPSAAETRAPTRPALKVVHLTPDSADGDGAAEPPAADSNTSTPEPASEAVAPMHAQSEQVGSAVEQSQRVVLYGEGQVGGVREPANQELP